MKTVCKRNLCNGCMACVDICPKQAIQVVDEIEYYNARIETDKCVDCGLCQGVCPQNSPVALTLPKQWCQGWATEQAVREAGSSGGYAAAIAKGFVAAGGSVCSCRFKNGIFSFVFAQEESELRQFAGSKYVKSNPKGIYKEVKERLKNQRVLFIGLPCQVAALKNYVGKNQQKNLYTIDLICHGTPSPRVLDAFLKQYGHCTNQAQCIDFRSKGKFQIRVDGKEVITPGVCDSYMISFLNGAIYTENCYSCQYARLERVADLTLGDSWGSELLETQKGKGVSLCLCQTEKGQELLSGADIYAEPVELVRAVENNQQLKQATKLLPQRQQLIDALQGEKRFDSVVFRQFPQQSFRQAVKKALIKLGVFKKNTIYANWEQL